MRRSSPRRLAQTGINHRAHEIRQQVGRDEGQRAEDDEALNDGQVARRSQAREAQSEQIYRARSPFPPDMPSTEKDTLLRQELARKQLHENNHSA
jgi:hypothetical protein